MKDQETTGVEPVTQIFEEPDTGFVACIEGGMLESQALLLFESIRRYAGRFRNCSLYALSPRAGHGISSEARRRLDEMGVCYIDKVLNTECPQYGSANRVAAAAHIEDTRRHDMLVILDSDTLFLAEPSKFILLPQTDAAARPVDVKGISTAGSGDSFDVYWRDLCRCCGVDYEEIPWSRSFVDQQPIKANYNGGLVVVRAGLEILRRWADFFFRSVRQGIRPYTDGPSFRAGAGWVEPAAGKLWGSNQAALSLAIWSATRRVEELPPTYNYPLHLHDRIDPVSFGSIFPNLLHVHYHWLFAEDALPNNPLFLSHGPLKPDQRDWLRSATPLV
jgi:hypothetical protein